MTPTEVSMRATALSLSLLVSLLAACGGGSAGGSDTISPGLDTTGGDAVITTDSSVEPEVFVPPEDCDDGDACTADACVDGACEHDRLTTPACTVIVTIHYPVRGATLWDDKVINVTGSVSSQGEAIVEAGLNGHPIDVDGSGDFQAVTEAVVGLNIIKVDVEDALGRKGRGLRSFLYGEGIHPPGEPGDVNAVETGSLAWLDQEVFDDDDTGDLDDFATLAWTVLNNYDLGQFIPHPLFHEGDTPTFGWCAWEVDVDDVEYSVGPLDLDVVYGGLALSASLTDLSASFSAVADWCPDAIGYLYADAVLIDAVVSVGLGSDGAFELDLNSVDVTVDGISVNVVEGIGAYFDWVVNWFDETITEVVEESLETWIPGSLIPMLDELLTQFSSYDVEIPIPALSGVAAVTPVTLSVQPSAVDFDFGGAAIALDVGVAAQKLISHVSPGSILRDDCEGKAPGAFVLPGLDVVEAALAEDLVNQLLFALWWGGYFNVTMTNDVLGPMAEQFGISALVLQTNPYLPPVITTCTEGDFAEVQIGALNLWASFDAGDGANGEMELFAHLRAAAAPVLTPGPDGLNHVGVQVISVEEVAADVVSSNGVVDGLDGLVEELIQVAVVDLLISDYLSEILAAYPIPSADLGAFVPGVPMGSQVTFSPETLAPLYGYWLCGGSIVNP